MGTKTDTKTEFLPVPAVERRSFATEELDEATIERIAQTRMHRRHRNLDAMLKDE